MIPLANLKTHLRVTHDADDAYIVALETAAVAFVAREAGAYLGELGEATAYLRGTGTRSLWLTAAASGVTVEGRTIGSTDWEAVTDFEVRGAEVVHTASVWSRTSEYRVVYTRGYEVGEEPENLRQAVLLCVASWYMHRAAVSGQAPEEIPLGFRELIGTNPVIA